MLSGMTMDSIDAVRVRGLRKAYGELHALDGVDLTVARGEVLALLGPNGAGKTTLVEILEGHRRADAGTVSVLGYDPGKRERAFRSRIGIVLQEAGLDPLISVREALELYGAAYPHPRPTRASCSSWSGLADRADAPRRRPLRRPAAAARPRARHRRRPRPDLPRRADDRLRPVRAAPVVGDDRQPAQPRQVDPADHALHGGGAAARRPRRRARARRASSPRARRTSSAASDTVVGFRLPAFHDAMPLPAGAIVERGTRAFRTAHADARPRAAARVGRGAAAWSSSSLTVTRPTLEDVYLDLTEELSPHDRLL